MKVEKDTEPPVEVVPLLGPPPHRRRDSMASNQSNDPFRPLSQICLQTEGGVRRPDCDMKMKIYEGNVVDNVDVSLCV